VASGILFTKVSATPNFVFTKILANLFLARLPDFYMQEVPVLRNICAPLRQKKKDLLFPVSARVNLNNPRGTFFFSFTKCENKFLFYITKKQT